MHTKKGSIRVLLWTDSDRFAGTERHCLDLAGGLQTLGIPVGLGCRPETPLSYKAAAEGIRLVKMDARQGAMAAVSCLSHLLRSGATDLVHVHNGRCALLARIALARAGRGTLVATQHFIAPARTRRRGLVGAVSRRVHRWVDRGVSRWIAISGAVGEAMTLRGDAAAGKIRLVFNGVKGGAPHEPERDSARSLLGLQPDLPILVCPARLEEEKGHVVLINALRMLRREGVDFLVFLVGEGAQESAIRERIRAAGLSGRVQLVGQQPEIGLWIRAADAVVLPSPAEPFGLVLVEAMCRGVPVVAAAAGGPSEILEDGSGLLFSPGDPRDLGLKLLQLLTQPGLRRRLSEAGHARWAAKFSVERMCQSISEVYTEAMGAQAPPQNTDAVERCLP
jgi:glycosyltransferase involved in cell wall biosynthesis